MFYFSIGCYGYNNNIFTFSNITPRNWVFENPLVKTYISASSSSHEIVITDVSELYMSLYHHFKEKICIEMYSVLHLITIRDVIKIMNKYI